jgi:hypothetical protein
MASRFLACVLIGAALVCVYLVRRRPEPGLCGDARGAGGRLPVRIFARHLGGRGEREAPRSRGAASW